MNCEDLSQLWLTRRRFARFHPALIFVEDRLELGAGEVLAHVVQTRGGDMGLYFPGGEDRALARLSCAYMRPMPPQRTLEVLRRAARKWAEGELALAQIHLAHAHLAKFDDPAVADYRLFLADALLDDEEFAPRGLLKALGLDWPSHDGLIKFDPDQPRVPGGNGRESGRWTNGGDADGGASLRPTPVQFFPPILAEPPILPPIFAKPPVVPPLDEPLTGPFPEVPTNRFVPPGPDYIYNGKPGTIPGAEGGGNWYNPKTGESLRPDFDHPPPTEPHWDWRRADKSQYRWYLDGTLERKVGK